MILTLLAFVVSNVKTWDQNYNLDILTPPKTKIHVNICAASAINEAELN